MGLPTVVVACFVFLVFVHDFVQLEAFSSCIHESSIHYKDGLLSHGTDLLGVGFLCGVAIGWIVEGLLCRKCHNAIETFELFTWSYKPTRSSVKCYFQSTRRCLMTGAFLVLMILVLFSDPAASELILRNQCKTPISICISDGSGPINVQPNDVASVMEPTEAGALGFWAYKKTGNVTCTNMKIPVATLAEIEAGRSGHSYKVSVENGYNLGIKIIALGGTGCPTASCTAKLEDCPSDLKALGPDNAVIACNPPPNCSDSEELCSLYSSLMGNSQCQKPGSNYEPSTVAATCDLSIYLVISFTCG